MIYEPPIVAPTASCTVPGCGAPTGSDEPGVDADLCPSHRAQMEAQRVANGVRSA